MQEFRSLRQASGLMGGGGGGNRTPRPHPVEPPLGDVCNWARNLTAKRNNNKNLRTLYGYVVEARTLELPEKIQFGLLSLIKLQKMIQS